MAPTSTIPTSPKPVPLRVQPGNLPRQVTSLPQWVLWCFGWKVDTQKWDKPPYGVGTTASAYKNASSSDSATWLSFEAAVAAYRELGCDGIGFVVSKSCPFTVIDLDGCVNPVTLEIAGWAQDILNLFAGTYAEFSPSRTGIRIIVIGKLHIAANKFGRKKKLPGAHCEFEVYDGNKYYTMTGHRIPGAAETIADRQEELTAWYIKEFGEDDEAGSSTPKNDRGIRDLPNDDAIIQNALRAANAAKFAALFQDGDVSGYDGDDSAADLALCCLLAFWCRNDHAAIDRLFRRSALFRAKWDERRGGATYGEITIAKAVGAQHDVYEPRPAPSSPPSVQLTDTFSLQTVRERRTDSGKVVVQVKLMAGDEPLDLLDISSTASNQSGAIKKLEKHLGAAAKSDDENSPEVNLSAIVGKLIVNAEERLSAAEALPKKTGGNTIRDIVFREVRPNFGLAYRTNDGKAYSEARGRPVSRQEYIVHTPALLLDLCKLAVDAPLDADTGTVNELAVLREMREYLAVLWATEMANLPSEASAAGLGKDTSDAQQFKAAVAEAWNTLAMHESMSFGSGRDAQNSVRRASLASRVRSESGKWLDGEAKPPRDRWLEIQAGYAAWWRPVAVEGGGGEFTLLLAMKFDLFKQMRVPPPNVTDQASLKALGVRYGAFCNAMPVTVGGKRVTDRLTGGGRMAVLSLALCQEILSQPAQTDDDPNVTANSDVPGDTQSLSDTGFRVTGENSVEQCA